MPGQRRIVDHLKRSEKALWEWFSSARCREEYAKGVRLELLKAAVRLEREGHADLYALADRAAAGLSLAAPLTIYQAQAAEGVNAALVYVPGEIHVVFTGPVRTLLTPDEVLSVLGHELSHYDFFSLADGEFLTAEQVLVAMANHERAHPSHFETARLFQLYSELQADRGSLRVSGRIENAVSGLVKVQTGLAQADAGAYLRQAEEIFAGGEARTEGITHPELFIRARALKLWSERGPEAEAEIARMIEGPVSVDRLDLSGQERLSTLTRRLLGVLLTPAWFRSAPALAHARLYFEDFAPGSPEQEDSLVFDELRACGDGVGDYLCYVLLDFTAVDPDLEEAPLAAAHAASERLGIDERFEELALRELPLTKKKLATVKKDREKILAAAGKSTPSGGRAR